jgi:hypothetical protein
MSFPFPVQTAAGSYEAETKAEDVGNKVDALDTVAAVAALIFGFGISIMYDVIKDGVVSEWGEKVEAIFISLGVVVVFGSLLPSLVIPFRAYYIRQILGNGGDKAIQDAKNFQADSIYMATPCLLGLVFSGFALVIQLGIMLVQNAKSLVLVPSACLGCPLAALTFWWILRLMYQSRDMLLPQQVPQNVQMPLSQNPGYGTSIPYDSQLLAPDQYVQYDGPPAAPQSQYVLQEDMPDYKGDRIRSELKEVAGLHKDGVLSTEELTMAKSTVVVQAMLGEPILSVLKQLQMLHKSGDLSRDEFTMAKTKALQ